MRFLAFGAVLVAAVAGAGPLHHFDVEASYEAPSAAGKDAAVAVKFLALDPDLRLNATPAPRLKLDILETALVDRQGPPPREVPDYDPLTATYLDLARPVRFPVAVSPDATPGTHPVRAQVVYFYCSVREEWCRRGTADVDFTVTVP